MKKKILTIPNLLSLFRLCLIPAIVWLYSVKKDYAWAAMVVVVSGLTDIVDGMIAREFDMVSDFGKIFDPIADKLTQVVVLVCLVSRFSLMLVPIAVMAVKELVSGIMGLIAIKKTETVMGADWHGKVNTILLYTVMTVHMLWEEIPASVSVVMIILCTVMMLVSAVLYFMRNIKAVRKESWKS